MSKKKFDYEAFEREAIESLRSGGKLEGKDKGVLAPLLKKLLEASLEGKMDAHQASSPSNRRNGKGKKGEKTAFGEVEIRTPRDWNGSFEPELIHKRSRTLGSSLDEKWGEKYGIVIESWRGNWDRLSTYFEYSPEIRRAVYSHFQLE